MGLSCTYQGKEWQTITSNRNKSSSTSDAFMLFFTRKVENSFFESGSQLNELGILDTGLVILLGAHAHTTKVND
jgi:hypothetical protein